MICNVTREQLMDYLYDDDLEVNERDKLTAHIAGCPTCTKIMADLTAVSHMLRAWPDETPHLQMVFVEDRQSFVPDIIRRHPYRWAAGAAATIAAILVLSFLNVGFAYQNGIFHASVGFRGEQTDEVESQVDDRERPVTFDELIAAHQQVLTTTQQMIEASESRQRSDVNVALMRLVRDLTEQRQNDLQQVGMGLQAVYSVSQQQDDLVRSLTQQRQEDLQRLRRDMQMIYNQVPNMQAPFLLRERGDSSAIRGLPVGSP
jgi:hypothetical protein